MRAPCFFLLIVLCKFQKTRRGEKADVPSQSRSGGSYSGAQTSFHLGDSSLLLPPPLEGWLLQHGGSRVPEGRSARVFL